MKNKKTLSFSPCSTYSELLRAGLRHFVPEGEDGAEGDAVKVFFTALQIHIPIITIFAAVIAIYGCEMNFCITKKDC
ncbi:MAG: hypothetical protein J6S87_11795 [Bacteroidales bacterium]|nr:hypothetical protein [Bacteroidales bacterium]